MTIERQRPASQPSRDWVEDYAQRTFMAEGVCQLTILPTMRVELLFHFGDPFNCVQSQDSRAVAAPAAAVLHARHVREQQRAGPSIDWFLVALTPLGCRCLLGAPLKAFASGPVDLTDIWGTEAQRLWQALRQEKTLDRRWSLFCRTAFEVAQPPPTHERFLRALAPERLARIKRVADLGQMLKLSERRIRQLAQAEMGMSVKALMGIQRMNAHLEQLHKKGQAKIGRESALEFADQSHASREFKRTTGMTQTAYARGKERNHDKLIYTTPTSEES